MPQRPVGQLLVLPIYASRSHPRARATTASCQGQKHLLLPQLERHQLRRGGAPLDDVRQFGLASADAGFRWAKRTSAPLLLVRRCVAWRPVVPRPLHRHPVGWTGFHGEWVCRFDSVIEPCSAPWSGESFVVGSWFGERASVRAADVGLLEVADGRGRSAQGRFGAGGLEAARCKPVCGPRREDRDRSVG
jgi:hypothetical protein